MAERPAHQQWLADEGLRLLAFAKAARLPEGFGTLDERGHLPANAQAETMNTARMTHSFAMAHIQGLPGFAELVDHGIAALRGPLRDALHGGWFAVAEHRDGNTGKNAYLHAFVALAASSAVVAQRPGAQALLDDAIDIIDTYFWSEEEGAMREFFNRDWREEEAYRGANSNMHATEAFLALADVTEDPRWLVRAQRIVERVIHGHAAANGYMVIEHFDRDWHPLREYNHDNPADGFRPYGTTRATVSSGRGCCCTSKRRGSRPGCSRRAGWRPMRKNSSSRIAETAGTSMARRASSIPSTGTTEPWCDIVCTGPMPKPARRPASCSNAPVMRNTNPGTGCSGNSVKAISSIAVTAAGTTNSIRKTARAPISGRANPISTTRGKRY